MDTGDVDHNWRDLVVFIGHLPADSAVARQEDIEGSMWGLGEHLQADIADSLRLLVWQKTRDGQRGRNQPKPLPRPGVEDASRKKHGGKTKMAAAKLADMLGMNF